MIFYRLNAFKLGVVSLGVLYVWSLPLLSIVGFAESNSNTVSEFIANPPATGAMASVSFMPLTIMWQYQNIIMHTKPIHVIRKMTISLCCYQLSYSMFLICTDSYVSDLLHFISVFLFCGFYFIHGFCIIYYLRPSYIATTIFTIGVLSLLVLIMMMIIELHTTLWFWGAECVGLSCMFLFAPCEWYYKLNKLNLMEQNNRNVIADSPIIPSPDSCNSVVLCDSGIQTSEEHFVESKKEEVGCFRILAILCE